MKKITFVQKQQTSTYDPVSTFFANSNKKANSLAKPSLPTQPKKQTLPVKQTGSIQRPPSTKIVNDYKKYEDKQKPVTNKIGRKGDHLPPRKTQLPVKKEQSIYGIGGASKKNIRNITNQANEHPTNTLTNQNQQKQQKYFPNVNQRRSPTKHTPSANNNQTNSFQQQPSSKHIKQQNTSQQIQLLRKKIKDLQSAQQQYIRKIQQFEQKQQKYVKNEQKLLKIQKQHKLCGNQTKQLSKRLRQKQEQIKKLMSKQQISYHKKRQILLCNQITNLKKINRQLVTRIKNYKGTDLVQLSLSQNKTDILFKQYNHSHTINQSGQLQQITPNQLDLNQIQTLTFRTIQQLQKYLQLKNNTKQDLSWPQQKKILLNITNINKLLSLQCLSLGFKLPKDNKDCVNMYNQIQKYRNKLQPMISKYDLNFVITEQNIELINKCSQQQSSILQLKQTIQSTWTAPKSFKKSSQASTFYLQKYQTSSTIYQKSLNFSNIILAHCIAQLSFIQTWLNKLTYNIKQQLKILGIKLKQLQNLCQLGQNGKQSLCAYVWNNIGQWNIKIPELEIKVKQIGAIFKNFKIVKGNNNK